MKRRIFYFLLLIPLGVCAKPYDHSLGLSAGNFNGLSYKRLATEHFAIQADMGVHLTLFDRLYGTFEINPNLMYQGTMVSSPVCDFDFFVGGGTSFGFMTTEIFSSWRYSSFGGKFGLNAIAGLEVAFNRTPLALSFDFRPGYGLFFGNEPYYSSYSNTYYSDFEVISFFDWGFALGLRFYM